jgi:hypothetical protein
MPTARASSRTSTSRRRHAAGGLGESQEFQAARLTLDIDKGYDYPGFVAALRAMAVMPQVAQNTTARRY